MKEISCNLAVIGAGPAGMSAALAADLAGLRDILVIEREKYPGGILPQCIHNGFGLQYFGEDLTGPEYAERLIGEVNRSPLRVCLDRSVLSISPDLDLVTCSRRDGLVRIRSRAIILAMGCRERNRGALCIPGTRPAGIFTAGLAQRYINIDGYLPGRRVVILGSGDIGLIMARRLTLEGSEVLGVYELLPFPGGLTRNVVQCLRDYDIPLFLRHTVTMIHGEKRLTGLTVARVDGRGRPVPGSEKHVACDTLLLSVGLIPENELSKEAGIELDSATGGPLVNEDRETCVPGIFACGNVLHVHDLVDHVSTEAELAGRSAAEFVLNGPPDRPQIRLSHDRSFRYVIPHRVSGTREVDLYFRSRRPLENVSIAFNGSDVRRKPYLWPGEMGTATLRPSRISCAGDAGGVAEFRLTLKSGRAVHWGKKYSESSRGGGRKDDAREVICTLCPFGCVIRVSPLEGGKLALTSGKCGKGREYARSEYYNPLRPVASTVSVVGGVVELCPVRTEGAIPRDSIFGCMREIRKIVLQAPVGAGAAIEIDVVEGGEKYSLLTTRTVPARID